MKETEHLKLSKPYGRLTCGEKGALECSWIREFLLLFVPNKNKASSLKTNSKSESESECNSDDPTRQ